MATSDKVIDTTRTFAIKQYTEDGRHAATSGSQAWKDVTDVMAAFSADPDAFTRFGGKVVVVMTETVITESESPVDLRSTLG